MHIVGLMSGTSVDGIDVALCAIDGAPPAITARVLAADTVPYPSDFRERVLAVFDGGPVDAVCRLNAEIGEHFAAAVRAVVADLDAVDLIGSHGQTVWHDVDAAGRVTSTLQIGSGAVIAERTGITTINNFRERDVAAGGQGAPLTAYADWLLLRHPDHWRAVQNIGGMGNVSFLPPLSDPTGDLLAFDTGPGNALIDAAVTRITGGAQTYDRDGALASRGRVDAAWLAGLMAHPYFAQTPPRTTGRELFGAGMADSLLAEGRRRGLADADIVATLTAFTAESIAAAYRSFAPQPVADVVLGGGGAHNRALVEMLRQRLYPAAVVGHDAVGLDGDYKEALVFALLAYETWHNRPGCLPSQTGARHASVLGQITPGRNFDDLRRRLHT